MTQNLNELDLSPVDLNLLVAFAAIYRERSVKGAARRLSLTPSAVSMALGRLRSWFEDPLFVRGKLAMEPTPRAKALFENLAPSLQAIRDEVLGRQPFEPARADLVLRLGVSDELQPLLVPQLFARLQQEAPGVRLIVRTAGLRSTADMLDEGEAQLVLLSGTASLDRRFDVEKLYDDTFLALYDRRALGMSGKLTLRRYLASPHVIVSSSGELRGRVDEALAARGEARQVACALSHYALLPALLRGRALLAEAPRRTALALARQGLIARELPFALPSFPVKLVCHRRNASDPAIAWLRARIRAVLS